MFQDNKHKDNEGWIYIIDTLHVSPNVKAQLFAIYNKGNNALARK